MTKALQCVFHQGVKHNILIHATRKHRWRLLTFPLKTTPLLFPIEVDGTLRDVLNCGFELLDREPVILDMIREDLDAWGLRKNKRRLADAEWTRNLTLPLGLEGVESEDSVPEAVLGTVRPAVRFGPGPRIDYEYRRCGVCSIFMACEPLAGVRMVNVEERSRSWEWAEFIERTSMRYPEADRITLVMENYGTHKPGSLYERFTPGKARALMNHFEFVYAPKHGSWLNMAEIELNVLTGQCLNRRIDKVRIEASALENHRNNRTARANWQFTAEDARVKLKRLYPTLEI